MWKNNLGKGFFGLLIIIAVMAMFMGSPPAAMGVDVPTNQTLTNPLLKGWLVNGSQKICGQRTWGTTGTADTLVISGLDTTDIVFVTPNTATGTLRTDISTNGDTCFVTSSASETATSDSYFWLVFKDGYNVTN